MNGFGLFLVAYSLFDIGTLQHDHYFKVLRQYPEWLISLRHLVSWTQRLAGAACGIGLLLRSEMFRRLTLALCAFMLATVFWKHPIEAVRHSIEASPPHYQELLAILGEWGDPQRLYIWVLRVFVIAASAFHALVCLALIVLLTRDSVKALFRPEIAKMS